MTNSDNGGTLLNELLRSVAKEYGWPGYAVTEKELAQIEPKVLASYVGDYQEDQVGKIAVTQKDGELYLQAQPLGSEPQELLPESPTDFFILTEAIAFKFVAPKAGKPAESLVISFGPQTFTAKRSK